MIHKIAEYLKKGVKGIWQKGKDEKYPQMCDGEDNAVAVGVNDYKINWAGNPSPYLKPLDGVIDCVAVTLYDKKTKTAALIHFLTIDTDVAGLTEATLCELRQYGVNLDNLEARLIGGMNGESEELIRSISDYLKDKKINIVEKDVLGKYDRDFIFDVETGGVKSERSPYSESEIYLDLEARVTRVKELAGRLQETK